MKENRDGLSFCEILTLIFIVLKFLNYIHWSWLIVLSPLVAEIILTIILSIIIFLKKKTPLD